MAELNRRRKAGEFGPPDRGWFRAAFLIVVLTIVVGVNSLVIAVVAMAHTGSTQPGRWVGLGFGVLITVGGLMAVMHRPGTGSWRQVAAMPQRNGLSFRLPHRMPHLVLDATVSNVWGFTNLPTKFAGAQRVPLGAPVGGPTPSTPLMARVRTPSASSRPTPSPIGRADLMAAPAQHDIEIVDDWMFFYTKGGSPSVGE